MVFLLCMVIKDVAHIMLTNSFKIEVKDYQQGKLIIVISSSAVSILIVCVGFYKNTYVIVGGRDFSSNQLYDHTTRFDWNF